MSEFKNEFRKLQEAYFVGMEELDVGQALNPKTIKLPEGFIQLPSISYAIDPESNPMCVYRMSRTTEPYIDLGSKTPIVDFFLKEYPSNSLYALASSDDSKKIDEYLDLAMATGSGEAEEVSEDLLQKPEENNVSDVTVEPVKTVAEEDEELINDETELDESKMKELHGYIDDGLSADQIAKKMKLDVKTIKALMKEAKLEEASLNKTEKLPLTPAEKKIIGNTGVYKEKYKLDRTQSMYRASKTAFSMPFTGKEDLTKLKKLVRGIKESTELEEANTDKYMWKDINKALMAAGVNPRTIMKVTAALRGKAIKEVNEAKGGKRIANKKMKIKNVSDLKHYIVRNYSITGKDKKDPDELRTSDEIMQAPSWNDVKDILKKNMFDKKEMDNLYNDLINYQLENAKQFLGVEEYEMKDEDND
tara:strand:+ start:14137 stop:15393 length:1257 start_codon:yes stop_codon:yes gene_type:complete